MDLCIFVVAFLKIIDQSKDVCVKHSSLLLPNLHVPEKTNSIIYTIVPTSGGSSPQELSRESGPEAEAMGL